VNTIFCFAGIWFIFEVFTPLFSVAKNQVRYRPEIKMQAGKKGWLKYVRKVKKKPS